MRNAICEAFHMEVLDTPGKRLRWARQRDKRFDKATEAAKAFGWTVSTYLGHENGDRIPSRNAAKKYAAAYKVRWDWILEGGPNAIAPPASTVTKLTADDHVQVPVRSYVGAGDEVFVLPTDDPPIDWVSAPPGMENAEATEVRGNSMRPLYHDGDLLFHIRRVDVDLHEYQDEVVVTQVKGGKRLVKLLQPGTRRGRYTLASVNPAFDPIEDQQLEWIGPIEWVHKRWRKKRRRK